MNKNYQRKISLISQNIRSARHSFGMRYSWHPFFKYSFDGIVLLDAAKRIRFANPAFLSLYGVMNVDDLLGTSIFDLFPAAYQDIVFSLLDLYSITRSSVHPTEIELYDCEKNILPVNFWVSEALHENSEVTVIYFRDISDWKQARDFLTQVNLDLADAYCETLDGWGRVLELRDHDTQGHTRRVTEDAVQLSLALKLPVEMINNIRYGAMLHDIGKMAVPDSILLKPGPLDEEEWKIMKMHPVYARDMLSEIDFLNPAVTIPYYHHEKWDGGGYPTGLKGERIPVEARIFSVIDVWDALISDRPYRKGWPRNQVIQYIRDNRGTHFDPVIADLFLQSKI